MSIDSRTAPAAAGSGDASRDTAAKTSVPLTPIHDELATRLGIRATTGEPGEAQDAGGEA